jgi:hypothetical protein
VTEPVRLLDPPVLGQITDQLRYVLGPLDVEALRDATNDMAFQAIRKLSGGLTARGAWALRDELESKKCASACKGFVLQRASVSKRRAFHRRELYVEFPRYPHADRRTNVTFQLRK